MVEHLDSYLSRYANKYWVKKSVLINKEVIRFADNGLYHKKLPNTFIHNYSRDIYDIVTGSSYKSGFIVRALENINMSRNLSSMTLERTFEQISDEYMLRSSKAWCPECLDEWKKAGKTIYEPLQWLIKNVDICSQHKIRLVTTCPSCGNGVLFADAPLLPGNCTYCGSWLGQTSGRKARAVKVKRLNYLTRSEVVGQIIVENGKVVRKKEDRHVREAYKELIDCFYCGDVVRFARETNMHRMRAVSSYVGKSKLTLDEIVEICRQHHLDPNMFLNGKLHKLRAKTVSRSPKGDVYKFNLRTMREGLVLALKKSVVGVLSLEEVARRLRCDRSVLTETYPDLCQSIIRRYRRSLYNDHQARLSKIRKAVRDVTLGIYAKDLVPHLTEVIDRLRVDINTFLNPNSEAIYSDEDVDNRYDEIQEVIRQIWHETLHEIGILHNSKGIAQRVKSWHDRPVIMPAAKLMPYPVKGDPLPEKH